MAPDLRVRLLLGAGVVVGLAAAVAGLLVPEPALEPPGGAVAVVDGIPIARDDLERAVTALAADRRGPERPGDAERVLDRLIDEELLLQHAVALGLERSDPQVRAQLVRAVVEAVVAESEAEMPDDAALAAFYEAERDYFARSGRRRVHRWFVRGTGAAERARAAEIAATLRAGGEPEAGDVTVTVPDALLPAPKLAQYLGSTLAAAAVRLDAGAVSEPIVATGGVHVLAVVEVEPAGVPPLDEIRAVVEGEYRRRRGEQALRDYLTLLRAQASIVRAPVP